MTWEKDETQPSLNLGSWRESRLERSIRQKLEREKRTRFEGPTEEDEPARIKRLTGQIKDVFLCVRDGKRRTLEAISTMTGHPPASVSAQLRHLRKKRFGQFDVRKDHVGSGLYLYWMVDGHRADSGYWLGV